MKWSELYQDIWVRGQVTQKGIRECAERYGLIHDFCERYRRPFTVLDIGAADGYFAVRLAEDFPECTVVAIEPRLRIGKVLKLNDAKRVLWLPKKVSAAHVRQLAAVEHFDVTLALSVVHWFSEPPEETINAMRLLGDHLILETPTEEAATGHKAETITIPTDASLLGHGKSHLKVEAPRPIHLLSQQKTALLRSYWGAPSVPATRIVITSDFDTKTFSKGKKVHYDWLRGINLQTFLALDGAWPDREYVAGLLPEALQGGHPDGHGDVATWNVVLQGDRAVLIDPKPGGERAANDAAFLERVIAEVRGEDMKGV